ncbi:hypothetical protein V8E53_012755, partial [Lactarius tabidus]
VNHITPRYSQLAIRRNEVFDTPVQATISGGGVLPFLHKYMTIGNNKKPEGSSS